jgi:diguanylate cyclase (GGDEF)-like protein
MNETTSPSMMADILAASGHVGYSWDILSDRIVWCGAWAMLVGENEIEPPRNAAEFSSLVLTNDHHLIFNGSEAFYERTYRLLTKDGALITVQERGTTDFENGVAVRQQGILRRAPQIDPAKAPHFTSPDRDPLTGRPSRSCLIALTDKIVKGAGEIRRTSAYMIVSVDKLAFMNEAMGTQTADRFLCAIADRLSELCPTRCIVGRASSDAFGILMPGLAQEVEPLATRILASFHGTAVTTGPYSLHVPVSIGSLAFNNRHFDGQTSMILAEQALRDARDAGGNRHVAYEESPDRGEQNRMILDIGERVKDALKNDKIRLAFQPVVDAKTEKTVFYEVLSRLYGQDGKIVSAALFIPIVEQLGLAPDFDRYVLNKSIKELEESPDLHLAVNVSGLTAALPDWPCYVQCRLASRPDIAGRLIIEITENAAVLDIAKIKCLVDSLRQMGSQVALDDFGAGATSIRHLRDLSLAIMKIDSDLLTNILESPEQQHLVRMLNSMAHGLGLRTVAEGIESKDVAQWLKNENVDMLQGFYHGRPSFERPWRKEGIALPSSTKEESPCPCS